MTAEVAIFNKSAIALATDSAVSIEGGGANKIYNNAEKLFSLTKHYPVGLMIYENNELQGVPWELIIKSFRKKLGTTSFDTLKEYKSAFLTFTKDFYLNLPEKNIKHFLDLYLQELILLTLGNIFELIEDDYDSDLRQIDAIDSAVNKLLDQYQDLPYFDGLNEDSLESASIDFSELAMTTLADEVNTANFSEQADKDWLNTCNSFYALCKQRALKQDPFYTNTTGLVFAGYGENEFFPEILECEIYGILHQTLKVVKRPCFKGSPCAGLKAFAQKDEVDTFMQGICKPTKNNYHDNLSSICHQSIKSMTSIIEEYVPEDKKIDVLEQYMNAFDEHTQKCFNDMKNHTRKQHVDKVVKMITHLPKNEMAYMAESLINLTAFKRKVSSESDSVGGPIDVAVISKGDGFVWIKRKHYFPEELNRNYESS